MISGERWYLRCYPVDSEDVTIGGAAVSLSAAKLAADLAYVLIRFEDGPIRWRVAGGDPTPSAGVLQFDGDERPFSAAEAWTLSMIRTGATNGVARVIYYRHI